MRSRRSVLCGATVGCTVALAGCADILKGGPNPDVGQPELRGSLIGNSSDSATVIVDVENTGPTGKITVTANVVDDEEQVLDSYDRTVKIAGGETRTLEFDITPRPDAATVTVRAVAE